jgi:iron complex transport system substrate-binding protein
MKMILRMSLVLAFFLLFIASFAEAKETIEITDDIGRIIEVLQPCDRIVFLVENALNTYYAMGNPESVAAVGGNIWKPELKEDFFRAVDPDYDQKPKVGFEANMVNLESLAKESPELVVLWATNAEDPNLKAVNETLNVPVYAVFIDSLDDMFKQVEVMGQISGRPERASEVSRIMRSKMEVVTNATRDIPDNQRPKVYWMWSDVLGTAGVKSGMNDLIYEAGGINVMNYWSNESKALEHPKLNLEALIALNPDVIYMWYNEQLDPEDISSSPEFAGWKDISAVKNGRVYEIENPFLFDAFSPRLPLTLMHVAKDVQPDLFKDLNLTEEMDGFFVQMYGVHYPGYAPA